MRRFFEETKHAIFVDEHSPWTQAGKMKLEKTYSGGGSFRNSKSYRLWDEKNAEIKFKGLGKRVRHLLSPYDFITPEREEEVRRVVASSWSLGPTTGFDLGMKIVSKSLPSFVNFKRFTVVRIF